MLWIEHTLSCLEDRIWAKINTKKIEYICKELEKMFYTSDVQDYLKKKGIVASFGLTLDAGFMYSVIYIQDDKSMVNIAAVYSAGIKDSLIICDEEYKDGPVYAVIDINEIDILDNKSEGKFYLSQDKKGTMVENFDKQGEFWREGKYKKKFAKVPFGKKKGIELMLKIIDSIEDIKFIAE